MTAEIPGTEIVPVLAAIIVNARQEILIARRRANLRNGGLWEFPGGKLLPDENPEAGLRREIREELGVTIVVESPYHVVRHRYPHLNILLIGYVCRYAGGKFRLVDHDQLQWVGRDALADYPFSPADIPIAGKLRADWIAELTDD